MSDLYQVVNENDEIVEYKLRNEIDFEKEYYRFSALWLTNDDGQVLMAQRLLSKDKDPGKWGPAAAGTLEKGEEYESNIYKEAEEEIGLTGVKFEIGKKLKLELPRKCFCQLYIGVCNKPAEYFIPQPEEVEKVAWIDLEELRKDLLINPSKYVPNLDVIIEAIYLD
jgi:isopentenyldiphosphate isomerase